MRVLLVTGNYLPVKNSGIENYTHWLAVMLSQHGFTVEVAAHHPAAEGDYLFESIPVNNLRREVANFESVLQRKHFDICHFHEYSGEAGINNHWMRLAKKYCTKVFFTFHLPYLTCYKNDFRHNGVTDCDTFSDALRCADCIVTEKAGLKTGNSKVLTAVARGVASVTGVQTKLVQRVIAVHALLDELLTTCDQVFIIAGWFKQILNDNGYNHPSIRLIPNKARTGISPELVTQNTSIKNKLLFIGRIQHQKGLHLLCKALQQLRQPGLSLDVYGNILDQSYFDNCLKDFPFNFKGAVGRSELHEQIRHYDFLVLPSVFPEMYPLVIMDAFHRELPLIASTAKGNKDVISDGINGFLFDYDNAESLADTIQTAFDQKQKGWLPVFTHNDSERSVEEELISYYR